MDGWRRWIKKGYERGFSGIFIETRYVWLVHKSARSNNQFASTPPSHSPHERFKIPDLFWDLPRNLVGPHWVLDGLLPVAKVRADENEREGDTKPHYHECKESSEGNGGGRVL